MTTRHIALISEAPEVPLADLLPVGAALQKQVTRDLGPIWDIQATVDCFARQEDAPPGYWHVTLLSISSGAIQGGIHEDKAGQPFALVPATPDWSLSASHEVMEMLVDPFSRRTVPGASPSTEQGRVDFLVEVSDPCQAVAYSINGVVVSDFYTPNYFDPVTNSAVRYSFTGSIKAPRQVLKNGYLTWFDPVSGHWFRESFFGSEPAILDLGVLETTPGLNFRSLIYLKTPNAFKARRPTAASRRRLHREQESVRKTGEARSAALREQIAFVLARHPRQRTLT